MELHRAIIKASKFVCDVEGHAGILGCIRLVPGAPKIHPRIQATDGHVGVSIAVTDASVLPEAVVSWGDLAPTARQSVVRAEIEGGKLQIHSSHGVFAMTLWDSGGFPPFPDSPPQEEWEYGVDWAPVTRIAHVAGGAYDVLSFRDSGVWATDAERIARADVALRPRGVVSALLARHWEADAATYQAVTPAHIWAATAHESRWAKFLEGHPPDLEPYVPDWHTAGPFMSVDSKDLAKAVKEGTQASSKRTISLGFGVMGITVRAYADDDKALSYSAVISGKFGLLAGQQLVYPEIFLSGKHLGEALRSVDTPKVRLCYVDQKSPLRVESGAVTEVIWPKVG